MIKVIGLTGPSGAGKTTFCKIAAELGIKSIDTDAVYHSLLVPPSPCLDELVGEFGKEILSTDGSLDRHHLAAIVFGEGGEPKLQKLNEITHKYVLGTSRSIIAEADKNSEKAIIVDAPALFESGFDKECDTTVCVLADKSTRLDRIVGRDGISEDFAKARIDAQKSDDFYRDNSDYTVINNGSPKLMRADIQSILSNMGL